MPIGHQKKKREKSELFHAALTEEKKNLWGKGERKGGKKVQQLGGRGKRREDSHRLNL